MPQETLWFYFLFLFADNSTFHTFTLIWVPCVHRVLTLRCSSPRFANSMWHEIASEVCFSCNDYLFYLIYSFSFYLWNSIKGMGAKKHSDLWYLLSLFLLHEEDPSYRFWQWYPPLSNNLLFFCLLFFLQAPSTYLVFRFSGDQIS